MASTDTADHPEPTRRDFLYIATGAVGGIGVALIAWPLVDQMNPDAAALALATIEVDVSTIGPGMSLTVKWRGKPVFIRNRTPEEIESASGVPLAELKDQAARNENLPLDALATDENRAAPDQARNGQHVRDSLLHLRHVGQIQLVSVHPAEGDHA
ncbi:MAG: ubiquinol-cytochrome c reductase iron-sulfur subunit [Bauldia sp.]